MDVLLVTDYSRKSLTYCKRVNFLGNWKVLNLGGKFGRNKKSLSHDVQVYCWLFQVKANTYRPLGSTRMLDYRSTTVNHFVSGGIWGKRGFLFVTTGKWGITFSLIALKPWTKSHPYQLGVLAGRSACYRGWYRND